MKLDLPKDIELLLHNYAEQLSKEEKFKVNIQQAFERLLRLALGGKDGND